MAEVSKDQTIFACPHCGLGLVHTKTDAKCPNGHSFDRAREGYFNLIVSGRISPTTTSGDTADSLAARRRFLATGAYRPLADALVDTLGELNGPVLDVGCGEGYYLSHVDTAYKYGIDISKRGIQMASKAYPHTNFVVGNAYRLPVLTRSCHAVFSVFAPHSHEEFQRVLIPGGKWVTITPGPQHLVEMRPLRKETIVEREQKRESPPPLSESARRIHFQLDLTKVSAEDLFSMTPLKWQTAAKSALSQQVTVDVWVASGLSS